MFPHGYPYAAASMSWPRPFIVGFILLMLFLSLSNGPGESRAGGAPLQPSAAGGPAAATTTDADGLRKGVKEQIIYDLSVANERLEGEVQRLKQYVLDLRRAAREAGLDLMDDSILTLYPELGAEIAGGSGGGGEGKAGGSEAAAEGAAEEEEEATSAAGAADSGSRGSADMRTATLGSRRSRAGAKAAATPPTAPDNADR